MVVGSKSSVHQPLPGMEDLLKNLAVLIIIFGLCTCWGCAGSLKKRIDTVEGLTDQVELSKMAVSDENYIVRWEAVDKLNDQTALATIAVSDKEEIVRNAALNRITDQVILTNIVLSERNANVRKAAVEKLTDQTALANIAVSDKNSEVRRTALGRLTDQTLLANIALSEKDINIQKAAVEKLTDQTLLANIAVSSKNEILIFQAVSKINNQILLSKLITEGNPTAQLVALSRTDDISAIRRFAALVESQLDKMDKVGAVARLKLAMSEPPIIRKLGKLQLLIDFSVISRRYPQGKNLEGEEITLSLQSGDNILAQRTDRAVFPDRTSDSEMSSIIPTSVHIEGILAQLFNSQKFIRDDFVELAHSTIPEVKKAAEAKL